MNWIAAAHSGPTVITTDEKGSTEMPVACPPNMVPGVCTCQRSCADPYTCINSSCHVTESCVCPEGSLMNDTDCIPRNECGCFLADRAGNGTVVQEGGTYVFPNCDGRCTCTLGNLDCENDTRCSPYATCEQGDDGWGCSCIPVYEGDGVDCSAIVNVTDCQDIYDRRHTTSGIYYINPSWSQDPFRVPCDMDGGGWTVFQRQDGIEDFYRDWADYKNGFGSLDRGMWLGNDKLYYLTNQREYELHIDFIIRDGIPFYANYSRFRISDESDNYKIISVGSYSGDTGTNALNDHVGANFSTRDRDNDGWSRYDCAEMHKGGWWFYKVEHCGDDALDACSRGRCSHFHDGTDCGVCARVHLNGDYNNSIHGESMFWNDIHRENNCKLRYTEMKIRPVRD